MPSETTMPANLVERLREECVGHPYAKIAWPHRLLHDAIAEIERLEAERDEARDDAKFAERIAQKREEEANERAEAAEARCDKLAEALRPFLPDSGPSEEGMSDDEIGNVNITLGMLRRAREALEQVGKR